MDYFPQSTVKWILSSMNLHVALCVVCGFMVFAIYIPNFIISVRNYISLEYIFYAALPVTIFTTFLVLQIFFKP